MTERHRGEVLFVFTVAGLAKTFLIGEKCYILGGKKTVLYTDDGFHRYTGFRGGEKVSAVGNVQNGRITADAVFAGHQRSTPTPCDPTFGPS